jgi:hypothetical protein
VLRDMLLLVSRRLPRATFRAWTANQRKAAENWASLSHLSASDNPVKVPPMPACVKRLTEVMFVFLIAVALQACNGTQPPAVDGAPCAVPQHLSCGYRVSGGVLETRCAVVCRLGVWRAVECLPECGTGAFYGSNDPSKGECYLPTVPCAAADGGLR